jgi:two-component system chemotaxis sensor kinase CheA
VHVEAGGRQACILVDEVQGKQAVVVKGLAQGLGPGLRGVSGGAVLGDGRVGLILDLETLLGDRPGVFTTEEEPCRPR